ncbi:TM2 domain-containing protein [Marivivens donghaensis]|uniref:TM2 domain-containing protein n=1 Tax=Marivivens donghaensis TaxID=1699413 RepID=UPI00201F70CB|nr:TM2 domain-containing protein [Marivivens donghaensis]MCL7410178.1 TM2 domain-containing protein [Marivivens donghaensis]MDN3705513.1 TM2 domain-containing protein [Marivivens donghaensis]
MTNDVVRYQSPQQRASDEKFCHACARKMHFDAAFCPDCGAPQPSAGKPQTRSEFSQETTPHARPGMNQVFCIGCGGTMHQTANSCPKCGARNPSSAPISSKDKNIAGLFALLLGGIGAHHFYLGNIGLGILYLLFCWTFIPMFIGFIEGLVFLTQSDENFARKYQ